LQTIRDRSARHADDIAARKQELDRSLAEANAELWTSDRAERQALPEAEIEKYWAWFNDESLEHPRQPSARR
jgi:hypothetical protein